MRDSIKTEVKFAEVKLRLYANEIDRLYKKRNKSFDLFLFVFFTAITFILYYSSIDNFFVLDDFTVLNAVINGSLGANFHFYPVPLSAYRVLYLIFDIDPVPVRILNIFLNSLVCLFVFKISYKLFYFFDVKSSNNQKLIKSLMCSLLFCIHYIHVETIIYFSELHEILYTLFYILGIYLYLSYRQDKKKINYILIFVFYLFCIYSKETAVTFIFCLAISDVFMFRLKFISFLKEFNLLLVITAVFIITRYFLYPKFDAFDYTLNILLLISEIFKNIIFTFTAFITSLDFMLIKNIYRTNNSNILNTLKTVIQDYPTAISGLFISFLVYWVILRKSNKIILISFIFILITILSFIWLVGYERYLYLPSAGFCIMLIHYLFNFLNGNVFRNKIIFSLIFMFFVYNIYNLEQKKNNWEIASGISEKTIMNVKNATMNLPVGAEVYFENLPEDYNGAWILRGFVIQEIPGLFLNRSDLYFYNILEKSPENSSNKIKFIYDCRAQSLISI